LRKFCDYQRWLHRFRGLGKRGIFAARVIAIFLIASLAGCAQVEKKKAPTGPKFANGRMTNDAVALEIGLVQLDESQVELFEQFWQGLDHQKLDLVLRQRLDQNGLRVGLMPSQPPAAFLELVKSRPSQMESLDLVEQKMFEQGKLEEKTRMIIHQRIVNRRSDTYRVETSEIHPQYQWTIRRGHQESFGSGEGVQGVIEINTAPQSDGTAKLKLTPRITYGPMQTTIGVGERDFAYASGRAGHTLAELGLETVLRPGETLVMAPTSDRADLGHLFFDALPAPEDSNRTASHLTHRVLLVRLVQTQLDDLFGKPFSTEPLASSLSR
jgi:hypothetical protein